MPKWSNIMSQRLGVDKEKSRTKSISINSGNTQSPRNYVFVYKRSVICTSRGLRHCDGLKRHCVLRGNGVGGCFVRGDLTNDKSLLVCKSRLWVTLSEWIILAAVLAAHLKTPIIYAVIIKQPLENPNPKPNDSPTVEGRWGWKIRGIWYLSGNAAGGRTHDPICIHSIVYLVYCRPQAELEQREMKAFQSGGVATTAQYQLLTEANASEFGSWLAMGYA